MKDDDRSDVQELPARTEPLMLVHLAVTRDVAQHREWKDRIEEVRRIDAVDRARDPQDQSLMMRKGVWKQMRKAGKRGAVWGMGFGAAWTAFWTSIYAVEHGFGWLAASSFLLPVPFAWRVARRLYEKAALRGMRDLGAAPSPRERATGLVRSAGRGFVAGFGFGFALVFLQGLVTWFMTPAPTFAMELFLDARLAAAAGVLTGTMGAMLAPMLSRPVPPRREDGSLTET